MPRTSPSVDPSAMQRTALLGVNLYGTFH